MKKIGDKIREFFFSKGYTCDACDGEIFDYPTHRLCKTCEEKMWANEGKTCIKCGRNTRADGVCLTCKSHLPHFTKGFSPFVYRGESAALINRVKNGNPVLAAYFGEQMAAYFLRSKEGAEGNFLILPVPLTERRKRERGYNQAEELAYFLRKTLRGAGVKAEYRADVLQKRKDTPPQKEMKIGERAKNVEGAYHVHLRTICRGKTILLVDDIMTTGATGSECAARLLAAGAKKVYFLCAASLPEQR